MTIYHGDCLEVMKTFEPNSISCVLTDPPYGLSFMGKGWDYEVPGVEYWRECLRVTKPGGHLLAMGGTRTFHRLTCAIEDSGYQIRDCLMWIYGSGFPKSHNKFGCEGYGTALKPSYEPIIMAMKPLDGTYKQNYEKWGQAGINIDECRISGESWGKRSKIKLTSKGKTGGRFGQTQWENIPGFNVDKGLGRWPANTLFDEQAAEMLDEQSGILKSGKPGIRRKKHVTNAMSGTLNLTGNKELGIGDSGGASRFFYCAKTSTSERNAGCEDLPEITTTDGRNIPIDNGYQRGKTLRNNSHPTVKPLKLMEYLLKLIMPLNGIVLDPFCGSGTTLLAAKNLGFKSIGIEKEIEYVKIVEKRLNL